MRYFAGNLPETPFWSAFPTTWILAEIANSRTFRRVANRAKMSCKGVYCRRKAGRRPRWGRGRACLRARSRCAEWSFLGQFGPGKPDQAARTLFTQGPARACVSRYVCVRIRGRAAAAAARAAGSICGSSGPSEKSSESWKIWNSWNFGKPPNASPARAMRPCGLGCTSPGAVPGVGTCVHALSRRGKWFPAVVKKIAVVRRSKPSEPAETGSFACNSSQ